MPISKINDDGSVQRYNKNTGQVLNVSPEELSKYNPGLVADYQKMQTQQVGVKNAAIAVSQGQLKISDIPAEQKLAVVNEITKAGGQIPGSQSATDKKKADASKSALKLVQSLEDQYQGAGGAEVDMPILSRLMGTKKDIEGALGFNDQANRYNATKKGFAAALKQITGDTGVLTDQDYERLSELIPGLGAKPGEAKAAFNLIRQQLTNGNEKPTTTTINPKTKDLVDILTPTAKQLIQDTYKVGTTGTPEQKAAMIQHQAKDFGNPALMVANAAIGDKQSQQNLGAAGEINGIVTAPGNVMGLAKGAVGLPAKVMGNSAGAARSALIDEAANAGKTINGEAVAQKFVDWADSAVKGNPGKEKQIEKIVGSVINNYSGKQLSPQDAMKIWLESNNGYNASGATETALESKVDVAMRDALRPELEKIAPGFDQATKAIKTSIERKQFMQKLGGAIAIGVPSAAAVAIAMQALPGKK